MKMFFRSFIGLVVIGILGFVILVFVAKTQIPDMVASTFSNKLKVPVQVGDVSLSLKMIEVDKLEIENPQGYKLPIAFSANEILVHARLTEYLRKNVEIDEVEINNIYLGFEFESATSTEGNWTEIIKRTQAAAQGGSGKEETNKKSVLIRRIVLTNIQTDLFYRHQGGRVKHLPLIKRIELTNIGGEGDSVLDQIMNSALGGMLKQVFIEQNLKDIFNQIFQPNNTLQDVLKPLKGLFNALPKEPSESDKFFIFS